VQIGIEFRDGPIPVHALLCRTQTDLWNRHDSLIRTVVLLS